MEAVIAVGYDHEHHIEPALTAFGKCLGAIELPAIRSPFVRKLERLMEEIASFVARNLTNENYMCGIAELSVGVLHIWKGDLRPICESRLLDLFAVFFKLHSKRSQLVLYVLKELLSFVHYARDGSEWGDYYDWIEREETEEEEDDEEGAEAGGEGAAEGKGGEEEEAAADTHKVKGKEEENKLSEEGKLWKDLMDEQFGGSGLCEFLVEIEGTHEDEECRKSAGQLVSWLLRESNLTGSCRDRVLAAKETQAATATATATASNSTELINQIE